MNTRYLLPLGVIAFAVTLAIILRDSLSGEMRLVAIGIAIGLIIGVPVGVFSIWLAARRQGVESQSVPHSSGLALTPEQMEMLLRTIERQQVTPQAVSLAARQSSRTFSAVGGAELPDSPGENPDQS